MSADLGFTCRCCGERHEELPRSFHAEAPAYWFPELAEDESSELTPELCIIKGEHFFIRGLVQLPILDSGDVFDWGVWVSLSRDSFQRVLDLWETEGREAEPPYFGWFSTELSRYSPSTMNLKTHVHTRPVGKRPLIELEATDHPLAVEQRTGITMDRVRQIAEEILHPGSPT
ncbi:hypothetical protein ABIA35_004106 [Catenulispora sp. MAP12-49]|uniref:DUF2199 domain-containing protein n=1 Tax=unclassified Catenulispora TaxID=414885 RepID=UPI003517DF39